MVTQSCIPVLQLPLSLSGRNEAKSGPFLSPGECIEIVVANKALPKIGSEPDYIAFDSFIPKKVDIIWQPAQVALV